MSSTSLTAIERLKAGIWDLHEAIVPKKAEAGADAPPDSLLHGTLPLEKYKRLVGQRFLMQRGFETVLDAYRHLDPRVANVVDEEQLHVAKCLDDVLFLGVDPEALRPVPAVTEFLRWVTLAVEDSAMQVLGMQYVIEGSNNGAYQLARAAQKAYGFTGTDGVSHLLPYGDDVHRRWKIFVQAFNENDYTAREMKGMIEAGRRTFEFMGRINREAIRD